MAVIENLQENVPIYGQDLLYGNFKKQLVPLWVIHLSAAWKYNEDEQQAHCLG